MQHQSEQKSPALTGEAFFQLLFYYATRPAMSLSTG